MRKSDSIKELALALSKAQAEMKKASKDSTNPFFNNAKYADLESVWDACREPLTKNGLSVVQFPSSCDDQVGLETILMHSSGEWICEEIYITLTKKEPQHIGSALSYLRRYGLAAAVGVVQTDDDGNEASGKSSNLATFKEPAKPTPSQPVQDLKNDEIKLKAKMKETIRSYMEKLHWDNGHAVSEFSKLTGKPTSMQWNIDDYTKVIQHLTKLLDNNPQMESGEMFE